ncbi:MAG: hypothetical protein ABR607_08045 [Pyrinomonadaceae bacterium]
MKGYDLQTARHVLPLVLLTVSVAASVSAQRIYSDPGESHGSKPYELPFQIRPWKAQGRAEDRSDQFYAVILKTAERCSIPDQERVSVQALFPRNKVFLDRFDCGPEDNITYSTVDHKYTILAVYGGSTKRQAQSILAHARTNGRFPGAYLKRMQVVLVHP